MKKFNFLPYVFIFIATFLLLQWIQGEPAKTGTETTQPIEMTMVKDSYTIGSAIQVKIKNNTAEDLVIAKRCPLPPLVVLMFNGDSFEEVINPTERDCSKAADITVKANETSTISLADYSYSFMGTAGEYKLALPSSPSNPSNPSDPNNPESTNNTEISTQKFETTNPGIFKTVWRTVLYKPILNALVAILAFTPGHYLGIAIILLTLLIRTILLIPSQKAMRAQRRMQEIQPKIDELKKKHAGDQARLAQETMLLWKTHQVSPFSSCLPLLIQFPILIALYYTVNGGLSADKFSLIYPFLRVHFLEGVNSNFLGFDLSAKSLIVFPLVIGGLQFLQMQLMMAKKKSSGKDAKGNNLPEKSGMPPEMESANKMMKYIMPVMIAVFTAQLPAAVGLYWGVSTSYGIIQQLVVNKEGTISASSDDGVKVRIINHPHGKTN
ncbi:MAG: YidC/Oxa1 family membrane protein insertase [Candidatus Gracilibacteria bacterium]|jgi:YidC/Oxa1 family membrane protein insertase